MTLELESIILKNDLLLDGIIEVSITNGCLEMALTNARLSCKFVLSTRFYLNLLEQGNGI